MNHHRIPRRDPAPGGGKRSGVVSLLALAALVLAAPAACGSGYADSVFQIEVTAQDVDGFMPWQREKPAVRRGFAVAVSPGQLVTTEDLVRSHTLVELRGTDGGARIPAAVELADHQANLALLRVERKALPRALKPLSVLTSLGRNPVQIVQLDEASLVQEGDARFVRAGMQRLPSTPHLSLVYTLLTDLVVGVGAAVVQGGRLAGLVISYDRVAGTAGIIPCQTIGRFLEDASRPPYRGFASAGFLWSPLTDPAKRTYLGLPDNSRGIMVQTCLPGSGADTALRSGDVITTWDGSPVDAQGFCQDRVLGRIAFPYLIQGRRHPGDEVPIELVRTGATCVVRLRLGTHDDRASLIPENVTEEQEDYLITGGLVLRELTGAYLRAHGGDWARRVDPRLTHLYVTRRHHPEKPGDRIVLLSAVLPDDVNIGYQHFRNDVVTHVNGRAIRNLDEIFRMVDGGEPVSSLRLHGMETDIVLDREQLPAADRRIASAYRIPALRHRTQ